MNGSSSKPPEIPVEPVTPPALPITEMNSAKRTWTLTLHPRHLVLRDPTGAPPYTIPHKEMMTSAIVIEGMRALAVSKPIKMTFKLVPETHTALVEWIGKPALARFYLKRRYAWVFPVAFLWVIGSMPAPAHPASGREALPLDVVGIGLGLTLILTWAWAKWRPHPVLFLVDSLWFLVMAAHLTMEVAGGRAKAWLALVALLLWMVVNGIRHFVRFKGVRLSARE